MKQKKQNVLRSTLSMKPCIDEMYNEQKSTGKFD